MGRAILQFVLYVFLVWPEPKCNSVPHTKSLQCFITLQFGLSQFSKGCLYNPKFGLTQYGTSNHSFWPNLVKVAVSMIILILQFVLYVFLVWPEPKCNSAPNPNVIQSLIQSLFNASSPFNLDCPNLAWDASTTLNSDWPNMAQATIRFDPIWYK